MFFILEYRVSPGIQNVMEFASQNSEMAIEMLINKLYIGRCLDGKYLYKLVKIKHFGDIIISQTGHLSSATIDIVFDAESVVYGKNEMIPRCSISTLVPGINQFICQIPYGNGILPKITAQSDKEIPTTSLVVGDVLPVRVTESSYQPTTDSISAILRPFTLSALPHIFQLNVESEGDVERHLNAWINGSRGTIPKEQAEIAKLLHVKPRGPPADKTFQDVLLRMKRLQMSILPNDPDYEKKREDSTFFVCVYECCGPNVAILDELPKDKNGEYPEVELANTLDDVHESVYFYVRMLYDLEYLVKGDKKIIDLVRFGL